METFLTAASFLLGAVCASFAGVISARLATGESIVHGRSRCDACGQPLKVLALVPVISYIANRGRAQCCGARISIYAPLSELLLGALFALAYRSLGVSVELGAFFLALIFLLALVLYDLAHQILPPRLLLLFVCAALAVAALGAESMHGFLIILGMALILALILAGIHFASRGRAMGLADSPLCFGLALLAGPVALSGFLYSFWIGALIGIAVLVTRPRGHRMGIEVPFAPFLAAGFLLAYFTQWDILGIIAALS